MDRIAAPEPRRTQQGIVHADTMATLGRLAKAVAHELNNPLSAILMYARLVERELADSGVAPAKRDELGRYLSQVQHDARHCGSVVRDLLLFARPAGGAVAVHHAGEILARSVALVTHYLGMAHVEIAPPSLGGDDAIPCDADALLQAFVALLVNLADTMPRGGRLTVRSAASDRSIAVDIVATEGARPDGGPSPAVEPLLSANAAGEAAALGLPGVDLVVQRHGGRIEIARAADGTTTVHVVLPRSGAGGLP